MTRLRGTSLFALLGGVLMVVVGALVLSRGLDHLGMDVFGALVLVLGLVGLAQAAARAGSGKGSRARLRTQDDGTTTTSVEAPVLTAALPLVAAGALAAASLAWGWAAWSEENPVVGVVLTLVGLLGLGAVVLPVLRGARPDRVDLSPAAITAEHFGRRVVVPWEDVHGCVPPVGPEPLALVLRDGVRPTIRSRGWPMWQQPTAPETIEPVVVRDLHVRPDLLARVVALCVDDAALRTSLGTKSSLDWLTFPPVRGRDESRRETP